MQWFKFAIIKLTFFLVLGILLGYYLNISQNFSIISSLISAICLTLIFILNRFSFKLKILFGVLTYLTFICIGMLTVGIHNPKNQTNHYSNQLNNKLDSALGITFVVKEVLKPGNYHDKYVIEFKKVNGKKVTGKSLLNIQKDSTFSPLKVDNIVFSKTTIKDLLPPLNPNQFNYKDYLKKQHIYHQIFIKNNEFLVLDKSSRSIFGFASNLRETINKKLKPFSFKPDELAIINALLLGQRKDVSEETYNNYANAGAIHILAVSGLHVGIILIILNFLFRPIERVRFGLYIKTILIIILLWCFAIVAGLSPSVMRAVTMFSIVAIGLNFKRATNIYNTLAISIFILLLFKPSFLFEVGFQLSYLAVFSIVWIHPLIFKLLKPKFLAPKKLWEIFTVTIAAQIGVFPVSLFYFHQFPGLFFISNLVIIPFLGAILGLGILVILLSLLNILPQIFASSFGSIIGLMNDFVGFISRQEEFLFKHISFGILFVVSSYLLIIALVKLYQKRSYNSVISALTGIAIFISVLVFNKYEYATNEFLIFHKSRFSLIGIKHNRDLTLHHNLKNDSITDEKLLINYKIGNSIKNIEQDSIKSLYKINEKLILVVDRLGVYNTSFKPDYVLLRNSPKINLDRLTDHLQPKMIIADGSNYKSYQERWLETCVKKEIPFHQTGKKGTFIIDF